MEIIPLHWDSEFFGFPTGTVSIKPEDFDLDELKVKADKFRLVYVKSERLLTHAALKSGDVKVVFGKKPEPTTRFPQVVSATLKDMPTLKKIGLQSGKYSRFALDETFDKTAFTRLYNEWVEGSVRGRLAYDVFTVKDKGVPLGLLTLGTAGSDRSSIGLFAVDRHSRGKGIGSMLLATADQVSHEKNDDFLTVTTQGKNKGALAVYRAYGFTVMQQTYIYHYWNEAFTVQ